MVMSCKLAQATAGVLFTTRLQSEDGLLSEVDEHKLVFPAWFWEVEFRFSAASMAGLAIILLASR